MPPNFHGPWWPTSSGTEVGVASSAGGSDDTPYYLASTDLPGGRLGVIVDTGAWTNLWGLHFAQRLAVKAHRASLTPTSEQLRSPLYVAGVGNGSQIANWELNIPIATTNRDGTTAQHSMRAPAVEGEGRELPALLGLRSMQANNAVMAMGTEHKRLTFPGPGGFEITWAPGAVHFDLESAPSGHLLIPVDNYDQLPPATAGLQPKQLSLLAVGTSGASSGSADRPDREFGKLKVKILSAYAKAPEMTATGSANYDVYATHDYDIPSKSQRAIATGIAVLPSPGTHIMIAPRSDLTAKNVRVDKGFVQPDHREEIKVVLMNHGSEIFKVARGMAIAQFILLRPTSDKVMMVDEMPTSTRGSSEVLDISQTYLSIDYANEDRELTTTEVGSSSAAADLAVPPH